MRAPKITKPNQKKNDTGAECNQISLPRLVFIFEQITQLTEHQRASRLEVSNL